MNTIYANRADALQKANEYQKKNGGIIFDDLMTEELFDDYGHSVGEYGFIVVGTGPTDDIRTQPFGDSSENFYYEL